MDNNEFNYCKTVIIIFINIFIHYYYHKIKKVVIFGSYGFIFY
jgi:hypothetical protein